MKFTMGRFFKKSNEVVEPVATVQEEQTVTMQFVPKEEVVEVKEPKQVLDDEIIDRSLQYINTIDCTRLEGSKEERATANDMLAHSEQVLDNKGALEPFYVDKLTHKYGLLLLSVVFLITLIVYPFSPLTAFFLYLFAIVAVICRVFFRVDLASVRRKDISFNVVNELKKEGSTKNTLIVTSNYSTTVDWNSNKYFKVNVRALFITVAVIMFLTLIMLIVLSAGVINVGLQAVTGLLIVVPIIVFASFYGLVTNKNIKNGLSGVAVQLMIMDYLNIHRGLIGENTKIVFCSFGGGVDSTNGAKAFVKQHFKNNDDYPNAVVVDISSANNVNPTIYTLKQPNTLAKDAYQKLCTNGFTKEQPLFKGGAVKEFKVVGVDCVSFGESAKVLDTDFNTANDKLPLEKKQTMENFYIYLNLISDILIKLKDNN